MLACGLSSRRGCVSAPWRFRLRTCYRAAMGNFLNAMGLGAVFIACVPTPKSCPTGHYEERAIRSTEKVGEDCHDETSSESQYNYVNGSYTYVGSKQVTKRVCTPRYKEGPVTGHKKVWVCGPPEPATTTPQNEAPEFSEATPHDYGGPGD